MSDEQTYKELVVGLSESNRFFIIVVDSAGSYKVNISFSTEVARKVRDRLDSLLDLVDYEESDQCDD